MNSDTTVPDATLRDVLSRVAAGELDPAEAARLLDDDPTVPTIDRLASAADLVVNVEAMGVKLRVIADPSVATAIADGPHRVTQGADGTLRFDLPGRTNPGDAGYQVEPRRFFGLLPSQWHGSGERITLRVNPLARLSLALTACSAEISGTTGELAFTCTSSSVRISEHRGALRGVTTMSSTNIGAVVTGPSSLSCELGSLNLRLGAGSDVTLTASCEMGSVKVAGARTAKEAFAGNTNSTEIIGAGTHVFELSVRMGSANVAHS